MPPLTRPGEFIAPPRQPSPPARPSSTSVPWQGRARWSVTWSDVVTPGEMQGWHDPRDDHQCAYALIITRYHSCRVIIVDSAGTVALSDRPTRRAPPARLEVMRGAFRCPDYWVLRRCLGGLAPCFVHGEEALCLNATVPTQLVSDPPNQRRGYDGHTASLGGSRRR